MKPLSNNIADNQADQLVQVIAPVFFRTLQSSVAPHLPNNIDSQQVEDLLHAIIDNMAAYHEILSTLPSAEQRLFLAELKKIASATPTPLLCDTATTNVP